MNPPAEVLLRVTPALVELDVSDVLFLLSGDSDDVIQNSTLLLVLMHHHTPAPTL